MACISLWYLLRLIAPATSSPALLLALLQPNRTPSHSPSVACLFSHADFFTALPSVCNTSAYLFFFFFLLTPIYPLDPSRTLLHKFFPDLQDWIWILAPSAFLYLRHWSPFLLSLVVFPDMMSSCQKYFGDGFNYLKTQTNPSLEKRKHGQERPCLSLGSMCCVNGNYLQGKIWPWGKVKNKTENNRRLGDPEVDNCDERSQLRLRFTGQAVSILSHAAGTVETWF